MNTIDIIGLIGASSLSVSLCCLVIAKATNRTEKKEKQSFNECKLWWNDNGGRVGMVMFNHGIRIETHKPNTCQPDTPEKPKMYRLVSGGDDRSGKARMVTEFMPITKFVPLIQRFQNEEFDTVFNSEFFKRKNRVNKNPTFIMYGE